MGTTVVINPHKLGYSPCNYGPTLITGTALPRDMGPHTVILELDGLWLW